MSEINHEDDLRGMLPYEILAEITSRDARIAALEAALRNLVTVHDDAVKLEDGASSAQWGRIGRRMDAAVERARAALAGEGQADSVREAAQALVDSIDETVDGAPNYARVQALRQALRMGRPDARTARTPVPLSLQNEAAPGFGKASIVNTRSVPRPT